MMNIASNLNRRGGLPFHGVSVVHLQPCRYRLAPEVAGKLFVTPRFDRWPEGYGVGGHPVPSGYVKQMLYPFQK